MLFLKVFIEIYLNEPLIFIYLVFSSIKDLMIWESYLISVSVVNNVGIGPASDFVKARTLEGIPSRSPTIIRAESINSTAISLTWQGPAAAFINGILNSFQVDFQLTQIVHLNDFVLVFFCKSFSD